MQVNRQKTQGVADDIEKVLDAKIIKGIYCDQTIVFDEQNQALLANGYMRRYASLVQDVAAVILKSALDEISWVQHIKEINATLKAVRHGDKKKMLNEKKDKTL